MSRLIAIVASLTLVASALAGPDSLTIGVCGGMTGPAAAYGISVRRGAELAARQLSEGGGVRGLPVRLVIVDDENRETLTSERMTALTYDDECVAVLGTTDSGCTHVASRLALKSRIPLIMTVATDPSLTRLGNDWVFRNLADDRIQGRRLVEFITGNRGLRRIFVAHVDTRYGRGGAAVIELAARKAGAAVLRRTPFQTGQRDFGPLVAEIRASGADAVVVWGLYAEGAELVKQLRSGLVALPVFGPDGLTSPAFLELAGSAAEGAVLTYPFDDQATADPVVASFVTAYTAQWGSAPDSFAAHAFDAVHLVAEAARRAGPDRAGIRDELSRLRDFHGVTGVFSFDATGNSTLPVHLAVVQGGRFVLLRQN